MRGFVITTRVGPAEGADLVVHPSQKCSDLVPVAADATVELPLRYGLRPTDDLVEGVVDPEQLISGEVHASTLEGRQRLKRYVPSPAAIRTVSPSAAQGTDP